MFGANAAVTYPFSVTTVSLTKDNLTVYFKLSASGVFYVDCGKGVLAGTGVKQDSIDRSKLTSEDTYTCTYTATGEKTIRFGGTATGYNNTGGVAAISFYFPLISSPLASMSGDLSAVFPYLGSKAGEYPEFTETFAMSQSLTSIPDTLFSGYTVGAPGMFSGTFKGTGLTSIPSKLFSGIKSFTKENSGVYTFRETFNDCAGLGKSANTSQNFVPPALFSGLIENGSPDDTKDALMSGIFTKTALLEQCPANYQQYTTGYESYWDDKVACVSCPAGAASTPGKRCEASCANNGTPIEYVLGDLESKWGNDIWGDADMSQDETSIVYQNGFGTVVIGYMCSATSGNYGEVGTPSQTSGANCWCRVASYTPPNSSPISFGDSLPWLSLSDVYSTYANCEASCQYDCTKVSIVEEFRRLLYTSYTCSYEISYDCNNSGAPSISDDEVIVDQSYSLHTINSCGSKTGYRIKSSGTNIIGNGWKCESDNSSGTYLASASGTWSATDSYTCTAQWECDTGYELHPLQNGVCIPATYNISYNNITNSDTWTGSHPATYTYGSALTIGTPSRTGYVFGGWCVGSDNCGSPVNSYSIVATDYGDVTLYAQWSQIQEYTVTYYSGNCTLAHKNDNNDETYHVADSTHAVYGQTYNVLSASNTNTAIGNYQSMRALFRDDAGACAVFSGWKNPNISGTTMDYGGCSPTVSASSYCTNPAMGTYPYQNNLKLYAYCTWATFHVNYFGCDGVTVVKQTDHVYGDSFGTMPVEALPSGYIFNGWLDSPNGDPMPATFPASMCVKGATYNLYADCVATDYNISYRANRAGGYVFGYDDTHNIFGPGVSNGGGTLGLNWSTQTMDGAHIKPKPGSVFCGWSFNKNDVCNSNTILAPNASQGVWNYTEDQILWAIWGCDTGYTLTNYECVPNVYNITYNNINNSDTWTGSHPSTYTYGSALTIGTPSRTGYTFGGWCVGSDNCGSPVDPYSIAATDYGDVTLYAQWILARTVTYYSGNCTLDHRIDYSNEAYSVADSTPAAYGQTYNVLSPSNTNTAVSGYSNMRALFDADLQGCATFYGWKNPNISGTVVDYRGCSTTVAGNSYCTNPSMGTYPYQSNLKLYAHCRWNQWRIDYYGCDGQTVVHTDNGVAYGDSFWDLPAANIPAGYTFEGWSARNAANGQIIAGVDDSFPTDLCQSGISTYMFLPICQPISYTVSFLPGSAGGTAVSGGSTSSLNNKHIGDTITLPSNGFTVPSGYTFDGWDCDQSVGNKAAGATFTMPAHDVQCTAQWEAIDYTVSFLPGSAGGTPVTGGSTSSLNNKHIGDTITLPSNGFTVPSGYTFDGWDCDQSIGEKAAGATFTMPAHDVQCTAQWEAIDYTVSFLPGSASGTTPGGSTASLTGKHVGDTITLPSNGFTVPSGYAFTVWDCNQSIGEKAAGATFTMPAHDVQCTAQWGCAQNYHVVNGQCVNTYVLTYSVTAPGNQTVTGTPNPSSITMSFGTAYALEPTPSTTGYPSQGWICRRDDNNEVIEQAMLWISGDYRIGVNMPASDVTCTAQWGSRSVIGLDWNKNGGTGSNSGFASSCDYDTLGTISLGTIPVKTGYKFTGWLVTGWDCDFSVVDPDIPATSTSTSGGTWMATMNSGVVAGTAKCGPDYDPSAVNTGNGVLVVSNPLDCSGSSCYTCWCKVTTFTQTGAPQCNISTTKWVSPTYIMNGCSASNCAWYCAYYSKSTDANTGNRFRTELVREYQ